MNFKFSNEQEVFLSKVRDITMKEVAPIAAKIDKEASFPVNTIKLLGENGIMAVSYTHLTLPTSIQRCRSRWSPYH